MNDKELIAELKTDLHYIKRACEMQANIMRDKNRTQAHGAVAAMCGRVADAFDRTARKAAEAFAKVSS